MIRKRKSEGRILLSFLLFSLLLSALLVLFIGVSTHFSKKDSTVNAPTKKHFTVVLDAGHGGEDGGAVGVNGVLEKDLNLAITESVAQYLKEMGISVICTRSEDVLLYDKNADYEGRKKMLDLAARLKIAKETENAIFVSVHMNSFPQTQYSGLQVYYSGNDPRSASLANLIQKRVREELQPTNSRKTKAATSSIYLLDRITSPAILVECGFLSNLEECQKLSSEEYRDQLARILAKTIADYVSSLS